MTADKTRIPKPRLAVAQPMGFVLACAWLMAAGAMRAQEAKPVPETESTTRLLTRPEGRAIVTVAWQQELPARGASDCSHLVHDIYAHAGFEYPYASSFEIYAGNENFARVKYPRAGDLIAWPGHVGIVVDPAQHSFYSLVRTGLEEQNYQSAYWRSRGRARFFRLRVAKGTVLTAARTADAQSDAVRTKRLSAGPLAEPRDADEASTDRPPYATPRGSITRSSMRSKTSRPQTQPGDVMDDAEPTGAASSALPGSSRAASSEKSSLIYGPPAQRADDGSPSSPNETDDSAPLQIPSTAMVATAGNAPTKNEVREAIAELSDARGALLQRDDPFQEEQPLVIVEQFNVEKVQIKRDRGWAQVSIDSKVWIGDGVAQVKRRHEKVRWELRKTDSGWETLTPADRAYVPHDAAVKSLSAQLARIAASEGAAQHQQPVLRQEAQLVGVLSALLENK